MKEKNNQLTLFEEALINYIKEWQKNGINPSFAIEDLCRDADELLGVALDSIPCWQKCTADGLENGLYITPTGLALVMNHYFVMVDDLVERLPSSRRPLAP